MPAGLIKHREEQWCRSQRARGGANLSHMKLWSEQSSEQVYPFLSFQVALKWKCDRHRKLSPCDLSTGGGSENGGSAP